MRRPPLIPHVGQLKFDFFYEHSEQVSVALSLQCKVIFPEAQTAHVWRVDGAIGGPRGRLKPNNTNLCSLGIWVKNLQPSWWGRVSLKTLRNTSARFGGAGWNLQRVKVRTVTVSIIQPVDLLQLGVGPRAPSCLCLFTGAGKSKMCLISEAVKVRLGMDQMSPIHPILPQQPLLTGYQSMYPPKQHCEQVV